ncbi:Heterodimeric efflux ABC transporter, permease/ATP-binding subunit 2 [Olavius algarvensis Delta 1 endosymbiont]|nr:Heterodimeric efflux ABC transporter, permease/ATP-binding subunit 2 [Olavius algarvensis Delta 1 endosymbiont]
MPHDYGYSEEKKLGKPYDVKLLKRLYPFTRPYRLLLFGSIGLVLLITVLDLALPYVTKIAIDRYIVPQFDQQQADDSKTGDNSRRRIIAVDLANPDLQALVDKYGTLFLVEGRTARIAYSALHQLEESDLNILRRKDIAGLGALAAVFVALVLVNFILSFVQRMIMEYTGHMLMHDLRMQLFVHIQSLAIAFFTRNPVGRLVTRVTNDIQNMHELFTSVISMIFKDLFLLGGIAVVMLVLNWKLALISFVVLPVVVYASLIFSRRARDIFRELRIKVAEINTRFSETIGGIRVIQLFRQEISNYRRFEKLNHENYLAGMRQIHVLAIFMPLIEVLGVVAVALVIFFGGGGVLSSTLSLGALVAFISYIRMFFRPIRDLAEKYNILQNAMASAERIFLIMDSRDRLPIPAAPVNQKAIEQQNIEHIQFDNVNFSYVSGEPILQDITFGMPAGETVAVVGPTGAGKTSLINLLPRFYDPSSGRVLLNNHDLRQLDPAWFRSKIALVMQDPFLFSGSIRENIFQSQNAVDEDQQRSVIEASNCGPLIDRLPQGLDTVLGEGGASISSGERQLISIARAFARNPQLILFDEATSYIDSPTELRIQQALEKLMRDRTALVVAHRLSTVRNADRIIVLKRGRIIESGTHTGLMDQKGFYYRACA